MRRGLVFGLIGAVAVTALWWLFLITPRNGDISEAKEALQSARDEEALLRTRIRNLEEIRDAEVEYLSALGKLDTLIPGRPLLDEFIEQINGLSDTTGVLLRSLSPSIPEATTEGLDLREIAIGAQLEGQFFDVVGFLFGLTELDRLVRVDGLAVSSATDESGETVLSVNLQLRLFTLADLVPLPEGDLGPGPGESEPPGETGGEDETSDEVEARSGSGAAASGTEGG